VTDNGKHIKLNVILICIFKFKLINLYLAANMKKAAQDTFGIQKFIPCIAHTVNLIADGAITNCKKLNELIEKVRNIVKFVKNSVNVNDELRRKQKNERMLFY